MSCAGSTSCCVTHENERNACHTAVLPSESVICHDHSHLPSDMIMIICPDVRPSPSPDLLLLVGCHLHDLPPHQVLQNSRQQLHNLPPIGTPIASLLCDCAVSHVQFRTVHSSSTSTSLSKLVSLVDMSCPYSYPCLMFHIPFHSCPYLGVSEPCQGTGGACQ